MATRAPSLWEDFAHGARHSPLGGAGLMNFMFKLRGHSQDEINRASAAADAEYADLQNYAARHPTTGVKHYAHAAGSLLADMLGHTDPTFALGGGRTILQKAAAQAGIQFPASIVRQQVEKNQGQRQHLSIPEAVNEAEGAAGGAMVVHGVGKLVGRGARVIKNLLSPPEVLASEHVVTPVGQRQSLVSPTSEVAPLAPDGLPGNGSVRPMNPKTIASIMDNPEGAGGEPLQRRMNNRDVPEAPQSEDILDTLPPANREFLQSQPDNVEQLTTPTSKEAPASVSESNFVEPAVSTSGKYTHEVTADTPVNKSIYSEYKPSPAVDPIKISLLIDKKTGKTTVNVDTAKMGDASDVANSHGPTAIRGLLSEVLQAHPDITEVTGIRKTGAGGKSEITQGLSAQQVSRIRTIVDPTRLEKASALNKEDVSSIQQDYPSQGKRMSYAETTGAGRLPEEVLQNTHQFSPEHLNEMVQRARRGERVDYDTEIKRADAEEDASRVIKFPQNEVTPNYDGLAEDYRNNTLTPAEAQEMDASATKPIVDNTGYEAHTPNIDTPPEPANDVSRAEALRQLVPSILNDERGGLGYKETPKKPRLEDIPEDQLTDEQRVALALKQASPLRAEQEAAYTAERAKRFEAARKQKYVSGGEEGFHQELSKLSGEYPQTPSLASIRNHIGPEGISRLFNMVRDHPALDYTDTIHGRTGLQKLLGNSGVILPTKSELEVLKKVFPDIGDVINKKKSISSWIADIISAPRSIMASTDLSAPLRQGLPLIHRKEYWTAFASMFKQLGPKAFDEVRGEIASRPSYHLMKQSGLALTDVDKDLSHHEERFMSTLANKIPVFGHVVKASERAYVGFLNKLRADTFDSLVNNARGAGVKLSDKDIKGIANYINTSTGRGDLNNLVPKFLRGEEFDANKASPLLSGVLFSPRLMASRMAMLNLAYYYKLPPIAQKEAIKSLASTTAFVTTVLGIAHAAGLSVDMDPTSTDFAKIRVGNTRLDPTGGFQSYVRLGAQLISGHKTGPDGKETSLTSGKFGQPDRLDAIGSFLKNKESPAAALAHDLLVKKDREGTRLDSDHKTEIALNIGKDFVPLAAQDIYGVYNTDGAVTAAAVALPDIFGVGVENHEPHKAKDKPSSTKDFKKDFGSDFSSKDFKKDF